MFECRKHKLIVSLLAAGLLGAGASAWAHAPYQGGPRGDAKRPGPMHGMERLHEKLKLNPQQEELWKKAQTASRDSFQKMSASGRELHDKLRAEIDKPGADLKQFAQLRDQLREQMRSQMQATRKPMRDAWFAVYDSLDAGQKETARLSVKDRMDRVGRGHRGDRRGGVGGVEDSEFDVLG